MLNAHAMYGQEPPILTIREKFRYCMLIYTIGELDSLKDKIAGIPCKTKEIIIYCLMKLYAAQLRQPIENSLVLCHFKTLRLCTGLFKFDLDHYLTNVARVKSTYWS